MSQRDQPAAIAVIVMVFLWSCVTGQSNSPSVAYAPGTGPAEHLQSREYRMQHEEKFQLHDRRN